MGRYRASKKASKKARKKNKTTRKQAKKNIIVGLKLQNPGRFENEVSSLYLDKKLEPLIRKIGSCTMRITKNSYQTLVEAIIYQQLSEASATAITKRFLKLYKKFPTPEQVMSTSDKKLKFQTYFQQLAKGKNVFFQVES